MANKRGHAAELRALCAGTKVGQEASCGYLVCQIQVSGSHLCSWHQAGTCRPLPSPPSPSQNVSLSRPATSAYSHAFVLLFLPGPCCLLLHNHGSWG